MITVELGDSPTIHLSVIIFLSECCSSQWPMIAQNFLSCRIGCVVSSQSPELLGLDWHSVSVVLMAPMTFYSRISHYGNSEDHLFKHWKHHQKHYSRVTMFHPCVIHKSSLRWTGRSQIQWTKLSNLFNIVNINSSLIVDQTNFYDSLLSIELRFVQKLGMRGNQVPINLVIIILSIEFIIKYS